jgi:hypothetical protein
MVITKTLVAGTTSRKNRVGFEPGPRIVDLAPAQYSTQTQSLRLRRQYDPGALRLPGIRAILLTLWKP